MHDGAVTFEAELGVPVLTATPTTMRAGLRRVSSATVGPDRSVLGPGSPVPQRDPA